MAKQLSELMKKVDPIVVNAARAQADQEIFELRLAQLRQTVEMSQHDIAVVLGISQPSVANLEKRCLLYTSPSPRDRTRSRMPSSA